MLATRQDAPGGLSLPDDYPHPRIELSPLSREDALALALASPEASEVPPHVLELAVDRSGGSPEFLQDLLAAAAAGDREELPESVGAATMARIDALDPRDGAVVRRAAVLGINFHPRRLADVLASDTPLPEDGFWDRLSGVFAREPDGHVRFRRPAIQEVAYSSLPFKLRRELHMAVGLDSSTTPVASWMPSPRSCRITSRSGATTPVHTATRWPRPSAPPKRSRTPTRRGCTGGQSRRGGRTVARRIRESLAEAWEQLGEALRNVGEPASAAKALTEARKLLRDDPIAQARLCHRHAQVAERSAALSGAVRWLNRGFRCIDGHRRHRGRGVASSHALVPRRHPQRTGPLGAGRRRLPRGDLRGRVGRAS